MWGWVLAAPLVSALGTWAARGYALRRRLVDEPGERRSHAIPTPRGGGIGPVLAILVVIAAFGSGGLLERADWRWLACGLSAVALIGAWDDHRALAALPRLLVHLAAGLCAAVAFGLPGGAAGVLVLVLVVASMVNIWNFMDGINGIASSQAAILALTTAAISDGAASAFALSVALAILAFVPFNFPHARVFLGDVGSGSLGYVAVVLALSPAAPGGLSGSVLLALLPASAFVSDAGLTLARRALAGERWWTPHTQHLYQAYARRFGHARVTLAYAGWALAAGAWAWHAREQGTGFIVASLMVWYTTAAALWVLLQRGSTRWSSAT